MSNDRPSISVQLATVIERLDNLINIFHKHQADDEIIEQKVNSLERDRAKIFGVIIGASLAGSVLNFIALTTFKLWGVH